MSIDVSNLERNVTLARTDICNIHELRTSIEIGTHVDGCWDCVRALMDNTSHFTTKYSDEAKILERLREGKKRARLMASAKKSTPTPQRKTAPRKRAASRGRVPLRRRSPSPAQDSCPLGQCWTCGSQKQ